MNNPDSYQLIDISQPVDHKTASFPGDVKFSKTVTMTVAKSKIINLTAITMSPHVGTHADAPVHITGELPPANMHEHATTVGQLPLEPYIGPCVVVDVTGESLHINGVTPEMIEPKLSGYKQFPQRLLLRTQSTVRYDVFEKTYAWISFELAEYLGQKGILLVGLDTPSVDPVDSKSLKTHHTLMGHGIHWLENLDLTHAPEGKYFLMAQPLKLMEAEASPVRAVLLKPAGAFQ